MKRYRELFERYLKAGMIYIIRQLSNSYTTQDGTMITAQKACSTLFRPLKTFGTKITKEFSILKRKLNSASNTPAPLPTASNSKNIKNTHSRPITIPKSINACAIQHTKDFEINFVEARKERKTLAAKTALAQTRLYFKGSKFKSCNKIQHNTTLEDWITKNNILGMVRDSFLIEFQLKRAIELKSGNCGELARIAYALCHQEGLKPELITYENPENKNFNHAACIIEINEEDYIVDPWANIFCKHGEYLDALSNKLKQWKSHGKIAISGITEPLNNMTNIDYLKHYAITEADIRNLVIKSRSRDVRLVRFANSDFFRDLTTNR